MLACDFTNFFSQDYTVAIGPQGLVKFWSWANFLYLPTVKFLLATIKIHLHKDPGQSWVQQSWMKCILHLCRWNNLAAAVMFVKFRTNNAHFGVQSTDKAEFHSNCMLSHIRLCFLGATTTWVMFMCINTKSKNQRQSSSHCTINRALLRITSWPLLALVVIKKSQPSCAFHQKQ